MEVSRIRNAQSVKQDLGISHIRARYGDPRNPIKFQIRSAVLAENTRLLYIYVYRTSRKFPYKRNPNRYFSRAHVPIGIYFVLERRLMFLLRRGVYTVTQYTARGALTIANFSGLLNFQSRRVKWGRERDSFEWKKAARRAAAGSSMERENRIIQRVEPMTRLPQSRQLVLNAKRRLDLLPASLISYPTPHS